MDDYSYGYIHQARSTELIDIAAMDRLAADLRPASAMRRYAAGRAAGGGRPWWRGLIDRLRQPTAGEPDARLDLHHPRVSDHVAFHA